MEFAAAREDDGGLALRDDGFDLLPPGLLKAGKTLRILIIQRQAIWVYL